MSRSGSLVRGGQMRFGAARPFPAQVRQSHLDTSPVFGDWDDPVFRMKGRPNVVPTVTSDVMEDDQPTVIRWDSGGVTCYVDQQGIALATFGEESEPRKKQVSKREVPTWMFRNKKRRNYSTL